MLPLIIIAWLVTVAGFLLYVRSVSRLRNELDSLAACLQSALDTALECPQCTDIWSGPVGISPIANSEQYKPSKLPAMNAPIVRKLPDVFSIRVHSQAELLSLGSYGIDMGDDDCLFYCYPTDARIESGKFAGFSEQKQSYTYAQFVKLFTSGAQSASVEPVRVYEYTGPDPTLPKIPRGWKKADGKTRHVKTGYLDVILRNGHMRRNDKADEWDESWFDGNIFAYRVRKPNKRKAVTVKKRGAK